MKLQGFLSLVFLAAAFLLGRRAGTTTVYNTYPQLPQASGGFDPWLTARRYSAAAFGLLMFGILVYAAVGTSRAEAEHGGPTLSLAERHEQCLFKVAEVLPERDEILGSGLSSLQVGQYKSGHPVMLANYDRLALSALGRSICTASLLANGLYVGALDNNVTQRVTSEPLDGYRLRGLGWVYPDTESGIKQVKAFMDAGYIPANIDDFIELVDRLVAVEDAPFCFPDRHLNFPTECEAPPLLSVPSAG